MSLGTVIVNETIFLITEIQLRKGKITFVATREGPCALPGPGVCEARVMGVDGSAIAVAPWKGPVGGVQATGPGSRMTIYLPLAFTSFEGWPFPASKDAEDA